MDATFRALIDPFLKHSDPLEDYHIVDTIIHEDETSDPFQQTSYSYKAFYKQSGGALVEIEKHRVLKVTEILQRIRSLIKAL